MKLKDSPLINTMIEIIAAIILIVIAVMNALRPVRSYHSGNESVLWHGSKHKLDILEPRPSRVIAPDLAVFATNLRWLALVFISGAKNADLGIGFASYKGLRRGHLIEARPDAVDILKTSGYLYTVSSKGFHSDARLGMKNNEFINTAAVNIQSVEYIPDVFAELLKEVIDMVRFNDGPDYRARYRIPED